MSAMNDIAAASGKASLRVASMAARDRLSPAARDAASAKIVERVMAILVAAKPAAIAAYLPIRTEFDPRGIIERARAMAITVALPAVVDRTTMVFRRFDPGDPLVAGGLGTRSPAPDRSVVDPDLVVIPMVAFDRTGARLGHGAGYYDRALAALAARGVHPVLAGVAFAVQEVGRIPVEPHDVLVDWIVTENEALDLSRSK
jgi:5-formyltetrahydrofolate cyclo-ligase